MTGALDLVLDLCDRALLQGDDVLAESAAAIRVPTGGPLRVGVVGRVNAGKSTLVNALIGQRVAPTGPAETTRVVTRFRAGSYDRIEVVTTDGLRVPRHFERGAVPEDLGVPVSEIDHVDVHLSSRELTDLVLVDTPGLGSVDDVTDARGAAVLGGPVADRVDAVIFTFDSDTVVGADQQELLVEFTRVAQGGSAPNAIAVLSKADVAGDGSDPRPAAERLCDGINTALPGVFATVVPVVGLVAETVDAGLFTEADAQHLFRLAAEEPTTRRRMLISPDRFTGEESNVSAEHRRRLLDRLGLLGITLCLEAIDGGVHEATKLAAALRTYSRIEDVRRSVRTTFVRHADAVKASTVLGQLERLCYSPAVDREARLWLADEIETLRLDPRLHVFEELEAVAMLARREVVLPEKLATAYRRLAENEDPRARIGASSDMDACEAAEVARRLALDFREFTFHASPEAARVARIAERSCVLVAEQLERECNR